MNARNKVSERKAYSIDEAAALYDVPREVIRRAIHVVPTDDNPNPAVLRAKKVGRSYRISAEALDEWWEALDDA